MLTLDELQPWLKAPEETDKAYAAFERYLALPTEQRSILAAYKSTQNGGAKQGRNRGEKKATITWEGWSSKYKWVYRVGQWEAHQSALRRLQMEADAAADKAERIKQNKAGRSLVLRAMAKLDALLKEEDSQVKFMDVFYAMRLVNDEMRNEYDGQPTQRHQLTESELDAEINRKLALLDLRRSVMAAEVKEEWEEDSDSLPSRKFDADLWNFSDEE